MPLNEQGAGTLEFEVNSVVKKAAWIEYPLFIPGEEQPAPIQHPESADATLVPVEDPTDTVTVSGNFVINTTTLGAFTVGQKFVMNITAVGE